MNSELPISRREVVALVIYAALSYNVLNPLLCFLAQILLPHIPYFSFPKSYGSSIYYGINFGISFICALAFLPFVSLIARGIAGRNVTRTLIQRDLVSLVLSCLGLLLFVLSLPDFVYKLYTYRTFSMTMRFSYLQDAVTTLVCVSVGFALAFFPAMLTALQSNARNGESATPVEFRGTQTDEL